MVEIRTVAKPKRWTVPFHQEPPAAGSGDMAGQVDRLMAVWPFREMDERRFPEDIPLRGILENDTRLRRCRAGDVIVRKGDYGSSAFLIVDGEVRVVTGGLDPEVLGRQEAGRRSRWRSLRRLFGGPRTPEVRDTRAYAGERGSAGVTSALAVMPDVFEATQNHAQQAGSIFGELSAIGRTPRAASVLAYGACELLEIRWQGFRDLMQYDRPLREYVHERYRRLGLPVALGDWLRRFLDGERQVQAVLERIGGALAEAAVFETFGRYNWYGPYRTLRQEGEDPLATEQVIAEEGHYPNGLMIIRGGFARLSRRHGHGERTISYLRQGDEYGLAELVHNAAAPAPVPLTATLRAISYVDVVRIPTRTFEDLLLPVIPPQRLPRLGTGSGAAAARSDLALPILAGSARSAAAAPALDPAMLEALVQHRFINGTSTMVIDMNRCTRCDDCVRACASGHDNNPRFVRQGPIFGHHMIANACMHCIDPVCMLDCPTGAISRVESGEVIINDRTCIGCANCADNCPYGNIEMVPIRDARAEDAIMTFWEWERPPGAGPGAAPEAGLFRPVMKAAKCDLCYDHHGGPACQRACPHDALARLDMGDPAALARWMAR
jgi:Fe-S-cluster-containing dehydrogenase component/CRP-like cAMP-binding protein